MYKVILASRYLFRRPITYVAVSAVALSVFIAFVVLTVLGGVVGQFKAKNHAFVGDAVVTTDSLVGFPYYQDFIEQLKTCQAVEYASCAIHGFALVSTKGSQRGVALKIMGIDPVPHSRVTGFGQTLFRTRQDVASAFRPALDPNLAGCVVGIDRIMHRDDKGQYDYGLSPERQAYEVTCFPLTAKGAPAKAGAGEVNTKVFYFSDTAHTGLPREDAGLIYVPFDQAQAMCMAGAIPRASAVHIRFRPGKDLHLACAELRGLWDQFKASCAGRGQAELLDSVTVQDWRTYRRAFIASMEKEEFAMIFMFLLVALTTVFIVFVVFYMIVSHKTKDIGILKSVGASGAGVLGLFAGFAALVGLMGALAGLGAGWVFLARINSLEGWLYERWGFQLWNRALYAIGEIPHRPEAGVVGVILGVAVVVSLVGAVVPAWQAARLRPVETLQVGVL